VNHVTTNLIGEIRSALVRWALLVTLCFAGFLSLHAEAPATGTNRFLFIVDTSAAMKNWEEPLHDAVFDFIYSGVRSAMQDGDSYGVWFAGNGTNDTSGTVETWKQRFAVEIASRAAMRVKDRGVKGKPALDAALKDAADVARNVGNVTVIVISNGDTPLRGTPFDAAISARTTEIIAGMHAAKTTVNTVLVAEDGKFTAWSLNSPDFLVAMPKVLERTVPPAKASVADVAKAQAEPAAKAASAATKPRVPANPIVITRDTVEREKQSIRALASTDVAASRPATPAPATTNASLSALPTNSAPPVPAVNLPMTNVSAASTVSNVSILATTSNPIPQSSTSVTQNSADVKTNEPAVAALSEKPATPSATARAQNSFPLMLWSAIGGAVLVLVVVAVVFFARSRAPQVSLVTQAAMLERMRR
jgi:hypothetical protein